MNVLALTASPNKDGLTAAMAQAALVGAGKAGASTSLIALCDVEIEACRQCDNGWGTCRTEGHCVIDDDFEQVRRRIEAADALVISTPVYFGDLAEVAKCFLDRLRRTSLGEGKAELTAGRWALSIACAGGGGGGGPTTLVALERYYGVLQIPVFDAMIATRRNREYMVEAARQAGAALVKHAEANPRG